MLSSVCVGSDGLVVGGYLVSDGTWWSPIGCPEPGSSSSSSGETCGSLSALGSFTITITTGTYAGTVLYYQYGGTGWPIAGQACDSANYNVNYLGYTDDSFSSPTQDNTTILQALNPGDVLQFQGDLGGDDCFVLALTGTSDTTGGAGRIGRHGACGYLLRLFKQQRRRDH